MGFTEVLTLMFIVLKLFKVIDWNWFLVLLPEIIACILYVVFFICAFRTSSKLNKEIDKFWEKK